MKKHNVRLIACSIFKNEIQYLLKKGELNFHPEYLSSMLHMVPDKLDIRLEEKIENNNEKFLLVYGDCCPNMANFETKSNISRTKGVNCIEIVLGPVLYRKYKKEGTFFFMPEWTSRWKEIFQKELQLEGQVAKEFMQEFHKNIIYIDTGFQPIPQKKIKEIEDFFDIKVNILKVNTDELKNSILTAFEKLSD